MIIRILLALSLLGLFGSLTACNTIEGAGKDVSAAGDAVSGTAEETKDDLKN
jgi:predicted small secreted protein